MLHDQGLSQLRTVRLSQNPSADKLRELYQHNLKATKFLVKHAATDLKLKALRLSSNLFPLFDHVRFSTLADDILYELESEFEEIEKLAASLDLYLITHPDQFIVLNSERKEVAKRSTSQLLQHAYWYTKLGVKTINIHGGAGIGIGATVERIGESLDRLGVYGKYITLENDECVFSAVDILEICSALKLRTVLDFHHHRVWCEVRNFNWIGVSEDWTNIIKMYNHVYKNADKPNCSKPVFHISSPRGNNWKDKSMKSLRPHADYINNLDWPTVTWPKDSIVEVEAKFKDLAVKQLEKYINQYQ